MKQISDYLSEVEFSPELFESLQLGMLIVRSDWTVVAWSEVLATWTGTAAAEIVGTNLADRYPQLRESHLAIQLESVLRTGNPAVLTPPVVPHLLPVSARGSLATLPMMQETRIHRLATEPCQALIILRDITAEQLQREAFHREHDEFISLQNQLAATNIALQEAAASAERANEQNSDFLANMSHEVRCLMTSILGYADLLADDPKGSNVSATAETIRHNGECLLGMVDDVLDLSRLRAGKAPFHHESADPCQLARDVATMMRSRIQEKGLSLSINCDGELPFAIQTDPTRVRQVLLNLLSNAVKYTETGGISVRIHLVNQDPSLRMIAFDVVDTGSGLDPEHIESIFEPFAHTHGSNVAADHGAGLGLTISQQLAKLLGGNLTVMSTGPQGTMFRFTVGTGSLEGIPLLEHQAADELELAAPSAIDQTIPSPRHSLRSRRILVAEDAHESRMFMCALFQEEGAEVTLVENGVAAVEEIQTAIEADRSYHLILMDEQLPLMNGPQTVSRLREAGVKTPIISMKSSDLQGNEECPVPAGCDAQIRKPLDPQALIETACRFVAPLGSRGTTIQRDSVPVQCYSSPLRKSPS